MIINFQRRPSPIYFRATEQRTRLRVVGSAYAGGRRIDKPTQENVMRMQLCATAVTLALLGSVSFAAAQNAPGGVSAQEKLNLSQSKEQQVTQGLSREPAQSAPGYQGAAGSTPPGSLAQKSLPNDVTDQVPETKSYLFIKLPDRIILIDPDTKTVAEIVGGPLTTGASPNDPGNAGMPQR
jgi:hypothetical protein